MLFINNIENITLKNKYYRKVIHTTPQQQLVVMNVKTHEKIVLHKHKDVSQFIKREYGEGVANFKYYKYDIKAGDAIIVPSNTSHGIQSISTNGIKLYTIYSPPIYPNKYIQKNEIT